jgi:hypothetical protein
MIRESVLITVAFIAMFALISNGEAQKRTLPPAGQPDIRKTITTPDTGKTFTLPMVVTTGKLTVSGKPAVIMTTDKLAVSGKPAIIMTTDKLTVSGKP